MAGQPAPLGKFSWSKVLRFSEPKHCDAGLALQLRFLRSSESIGHHDSEIVDDAYFDRDDAGALGVIAAGCQSAHGALVLPGAGGGFCGLIPGRTTRRRA